MFFALMVSIHYLTLEDINLMDEHKKISVLIVDDHDMVRKGIRILLGAFDDFEVVADSDDPRMILTLCTTYQPDVVLMDLLMPQMNGIAATKLIRNHFPHIQVVALTSSIEQALVKDALQAGAISYILKVGSIDEVASTVRAAYLRNTTLSPDAMAVLLSSANQTPYNLTKQERKVLKMLVEGFSNRNIADALVVSLSTAKAHVSNILSKLKTKSRTTAITLALQHQILDSDEDLN
jgi:NarL family two-component system response regulator LiaR